MTLAELFAKIPVAKHKNIVTFPGNNVIYDDGATIYRAVIDSSGQLVPLDAATKAKLIALGG